METGGSVDQQAIFDAALTELRLRGFDNLTLEGVAMRAGVEPEVIIARWGDRRVLLMDAQLSRARGNIPVPDSGSLRGDLEAYLAALDEHTSTRDGRAWFFRLLPADHAVDLSEMRSDFWHIRFDESASILRRAAERGELRDGIDPLEATRMLITAFLYDVIFTDSAVRTEYAAQMLDIFIRGISKP